MRFKRGVIILIRDREEIIIIAHDFYFLFLWLQYLLLGVSIFKIDNLQSAISIVQTNPLWLIRIIQNYLSTTKGWMEFMSLIIKDISLAALVLFIIFWMFEKRRMILLSLLIPLIFLNFILLSLKSKTFVQGLRIVRFSGLGLSIVSVIIVGYFFFKFIVRFYSLNNDV